MEAIDVLAIIQQYVNLQAVALAVAATQLLKYLMPNPKPGEVSSQTVSGHWATRLLPVFPLVLGAVFYQLVIDDHTFRTENIVKGAMSGVLAAWMYRTTKVSFFGE